MAEQLVMFPEDTEATLEVCKVRFEETVGTNANELFSGFNHLYVVTFSYGLNFIEKISQKFDTVDIVLGCPGLVKYDMKEIMSFQEKSLVMINKHQKLVSRVMSGDVHISILKTFVSHEKLYILTDDFGNSRIITGSANFSGRAFSGAMREGIFVYENDELALDYFMDEFEFLRDESSNKVTVDSLYCGEKEDIDIEDLPIVREARIKNVGIVVDNENCDKDEIEFITDVSALAAKKYSKLNIKPEKDGKAMYISPAAIHALIRQHKDIRKQESQKRKEFPQFVIDYDEQDAIFNGKLYDLNPEMSEVKNDLEHINIFYDGFKDFIGYNEQNMVEYYKLMNFMFLSPFIAKLRSVSDVAEYGEEYFPYYIVLNGKKSSGKSTLVETIHYIMFGKKLGKLNDDIFVKTKMAAYLTEAKGVPCLIDDIGRTRFNDGASFIKSDEWLRRQKYENHPVFVLTSNDIDTIKQELAKRVIYLSVDMTQENVTAVLKRKKMSENRKNISTAFYREYLKRMFSQVSDMLEIMRNSRAKEEREIKRVLDVFKISSNVIMDIYQDCGVELPSNFKEISYDDYFGYNTIVNNIKEKILLDWKHNRNAFKVFRRSNTLEYSNFEKRFEADRILHSLPEKLEAKRTGLKIVMKLDKAEKFFGVRFHNSIFK